MRAAVVLSVAAAAAAAVAAQPSPYAHLKMGPAQAPGLPAFQQARFGLFIHWGAVAQWGTEISFPLTCPSFPCDSRGPGNVPVTLHNESELAAHRAAYAALARTFNPTAFDPAALAGLAHAAGFRYMTWVATHCDGEWGSRRRSAG